MCNAALQVFHFQVSRVTIEVQQTLAELNDAMPKMMQVGSISGMNQYSMQI